MRELCKVVNIMEKGIENCCLLSLSTQDLDHIKEFAGSQLRADKRNALSDDAQRTCRACCKY